MRTIIFLLLALLLCMVGVSQAQYVSVNHQIISGTHYNINTGDSTRASSSTIALQAIPLAVTAAEAAKYPGLSVGQVPDSVFVSYWATTDTLAADVVFKAKNSPGTVWYYTYVDSIKTAVGGRTALTMNKFLGKDLIGASLKQRATGASAIAANCLAYLRLTRKFKIQ